MINHFYASACRWLIHVITFQLFISLMSLPLLITWGLPLSLLSPLGNSIFNPLLAFFLLISSLLFIAELLYLPNQWLCWLLEKTNNLFIITSTYGDSSWLVGIRQLPTPLLFCIPLIGLWIILTPRLHRQGARALALSATLIVIFAGTYITDRPYLGTCASNHKHAPLIIAYTDHTLAVFDQGALSASSRCHSWWDYTVMSHIIKKTGKTTIDYLVCLQPSSRTLEGITFIANITPLRHVILVLSQHTKNALQEELHSLINELSLKKISCTLQILERQEQLTSLADTTSQASSTPSCTRSSWTPNKNRFKTHQLTSKINYTLRILSHKGSSCISGALISCDNQTLTLGTTTESDALSTTPQNLDKLQSEL